jgi:hypothetical protein
MNASGGDEYAWEALAEEEQEQEQGAVSAESTGSEYTAEADESIGSAYTVDGGEETCTSVVAEHCLLVEEMLAGEAGDVLPVAAAAGTRALAYSARRAADTHPRPLRCSSRSASVASNTVYPSGATETAHGVNVEYGVGVSDICCVCVWVGKCLVLSVAH